MEPYPLMIVVDWPEMSVLSRYPSDHVGLCGLLTCGHYSSPCSHMSSTWEFFDEAQPCPDGCGFRQFDLRLQAALADDAEIDSEDRRANPRPLPW